jgi:hypothetical protein
MQTDPTMTDPILRRLTDAAATLVEQGHAESKVVDAMLTITTAWAVAHEGPQAVARRLYMLALQFAAQAERQEPGPRSH